MNNLDKIYKEFGEHICLYPFFGAFYQTNHVVPRDSNGQSNSVRPCSLIQEEDRHHWDIDNGSLIAARNNTKWIKLRQQFLDGKFHELSGCRSCSYNEKMGATSPRIQNNMFYVQNFDFDIIERLKEIQNNSLHSNDIIALEYYPSNYCNYACIMCAGGASSNRLTYELRVLGRKERICLNEPDKDFYKALENIEILNFTGGETILQQQVVDIIDHLINIGRADKVLITLLTNSSSFPEHLIEKFKKFKRVIYNVSIDGVGPVIEYQRRGCYWPTVEENSLKLLKHDFIITLINYVLIAVNVLSFMDFIDWCFEHQIGPRSAKYLDVQYISISPVFRAEYLGQSALPPELRQLALDRLHKGIEKYSQYNNTLANYHCNLIRMVINVIEKTEFNPRHLKQFIDHINNEDSVSKLKLVDAVPEWQTYFTNHDLTMEIILAS